MRQAAILGALLLLLGCESDEQQLERLQNEVRTAELRVWGWENNRDPERKGYADSLQAARNQFLLAERELRQFMGQP